MTIIPFSFDTHALRTIMRDGEPWFHAADVCAVLAIQNVPQAIAPLAERHKHMQNIGLPGSAPTFISEAGLYKLVLRSNKAQAERFQDWIAEEVLPSIRKTGGYGISAPHDAALATLRRIHAEADREVEQRTQHDFHRPGNARAAEHVKAVIEEVAAKRGLGVDAVTLGYQQSVEHVMAATYGDTVAQARLDRKRLELAPPPKRRPKVATRRRYIA